MIPFLMRVAYNWPTSLVTVRACCSNPKPQLMYDTIKKKRVLQCMNCSAFVG